MNKLELEFYEFSKTLTGSTAVGFSGGSDSMAVLHLAHKLIRNFDVVYFAHGDNPLVDDDAKAIEFCRGVCQKLGRSLKVVELNLEKTKAGWEASGHTARLLYAKTHYDNFLLGHHQDDVCENYFIQLMRGAGSARVLKSEDTMKRPLLKFSKSDIKEYLVKKQINWLEDLTNENTDITRNHWRQVVLPAIESHYPQYRQRLSTAVSVEAQNMELLKDLAVLDGLDTLVSSNTLTVKLSDKRLSNLMYFYCKSLGQSVQRPKLDEFVKQVSRPQREITTDILGTIITVSKSEGTMTIHTAKPQNKLKL